MTCARQRDEFFFVIKYTPERKPSFGLHVDHTKVTVNIALTDGFEGGDRQPSR